MGYIEDSLKRKSLPIHLVVFIMAIIGAFSCIKLFSPHIVNLIYFLVLAGFTISFFYHEKVDITKNVVTVAALVALIMAISTIFMEKSTAIVILVMCMVWILAFLSFALNKARDYFLMMYVSSITIMASIAMGLNTKTIELGCVIAAIMCWIAFLRFGFMRTKLDVNQQFVLAEKGQAGVQNQLRIILIILIFISFIGFPVYRVFPHAHVIIPSLINLIPKTYNWDLIDIPRFSPYRMPGRSKTKYSDEEVKKGKTAQMGLGKKAKRKLVDIKKENQQIQFYHGVEEDLSESEATSSKKQESQKEEFKERDLTKEPKPSSAQPMPEMKKLDEALSEALNELKERQGIDLKKLNELELKLKSLKQDILSKEKPDPREKQVSQSVTNIINELKIQQEINREILENLNEQLADTHNELNLSSQGWQILEVSYQNLSNQENSLNQAIAQSVSLLSEKQNTNINELNNLKEELNNTKQQLDLKQNPTSQEKALSESVAQAISSLDERNKEANQTLNDLKGDLNAVKDAQTDTSQIRNALQNQQSSLTNQGKSLTQSISQISSDINENQQLNNQVINNLIEQLNSVSGALNLSSSISGETTASQQNLSNQENSLNQAIAQSVSLLSEKQNTNINELNNLKEELNNTKQQLDLKQNPTSQEKALSESVAQAISSLDERNKEANQTLNDLKGDLNAVKKALNDATETGNTFQKQQQNFMNKQTALNNSLNDGTKELKDIQQQISEQVKHLEEFIKKEREKIKKIEQVQNFQPPLKKNILLFWLIILLLILLILIICAFIARKAILVYLEHNRLRKFYRADPRMFIIKLYRFLLKMMVYYGFKKPIWMTAVEYRDALVEKLTMLIEELRRITNLFTLARYSRMDMTEEDANFFLLSYYKITEELKENQGTFFKNFQALINGMNLRIKT